VYGDIGTSPLYAMQSALGAAGTFNAAAVLGVLSLIFWSLAISVTLKYLTVIMRADNEGEGGILALFALAQRRLITGSTWAKVAVGLALAGTAFFFCDALITPAISVLSAVEGLEVLNPPQDRGRHRLCRLSRVAPRHASTGDSHVRTRLIEAGSEPPGPPPRSTPRSPA